MPSKPLHAARRGARRASGDVGRARASVDMDRCLSEEQPDIRVTTDTLWLMPVVELEPGRFGSVPQPSSGPWTDTESDGYWRACLRAGGLVGADPIVPGSWFVACDALTSQDALIKVLHAHLGDSVPVDDEVGPLCGGLALVDGVDVLLLPTCCGDLGDIENWRTAAHRLAESPEMLWIGHPWLMAWYDASMLHVREEPEGGMPAQPREFVMKPEILQRAVRLAAQALDVFAERVASALRHIPGVIDARATARILAGRAAGPSSWT
ncbi:hypothetical protein WME99_44975 [Sorangium sp. So ce136]|uniref:hypothetical protein n=1 Tax=Sorangium sp. So ce136 TaxID=3133284 RepID=UPI003F00B290